MKVDTRLKWLRREQKLLQIKVKIKLSRYGPGFSLGVPGG
jgi:hypothetical protein